MFRDVYGDDRFHCDALIRRIGFDCYFIGNKANIRVFCFHRIDRDFVTINSSRALKEKFNSKDIFL